MRDVLGNADPSYHRFFGDPGEVFRTSAGAGHVRGNKTGSDGIHGDAVRPKIHREAAGHHGHRRLRSGVEGGSGHGGAEGGDGRQVDDAAESSLLHTVDHSARHIHQAVHVGVAHALHLAEVEVADIAAAHHSGIIDQDVERPEFPGGALHHRTDLRGVAHVRLGGDSLSATRPDLLRQRFGFGGALAIIDGDGGAVPSQPQRDGPAQASGSAGYQRSLSRQCHRSII